MTDILTATKEASERWKNAFNSGNAAACAAEYEADAVMQAEPFGTFTGQEAIQAFWQKLIDDGFSEVTYIEPKFEVVDDHSVIISSNWTMNKAQGVIYKELWVRQTDGTAKMRSDHFEAKG